MNLKGETREEAKWIYLAMEKNGSEAERETANRFLRTLDGLFGCSEVACGGESGAELARVARPSNLGQGIWAVVENHPGRILTSCKRCGRTFFAPSLGRQAEFCSPACRSAYSKGY